MTKPSRHIAKKTRKCRGKSQHHRKIYAQPKHNKRRARKTQQQRKTSTNTKHNTSTFATRLMCCQRNAFKNKTSNQSKLSKNISELAIGRYNLWELPHEKRDWWPMFEATNRNRAIESQDRHDVVYFTLVCITARTCPMRVSTVS